MNDEDCNQTFGAKSCSENSTSINGKCMGFVNMRGRWNWLRIMADIIIDNVETLVSVPIQLVS